MKEFNLERWLRTGEELITRNSEKMLATKYCPNNENDYKIRSLTETGKMHSCFENGSYQDDVTAHDGDLFFVNDIEPEPKPKRGDTVWVRDHEQTIWTAKIFLAEFKNAVYPYKTVLGSNEELFITGKTYGDSAWKYMRTTNPALDKPKIEITVKVNGKEVKLSTLSDESILAIKNAAK